MPKFSASAAFCEGNPEVIGAYPQRAANGEIWWLLWLILVWASFWISNQVAMDTSWHGIITGWSWARKAESWYIISFCLNKLLKKWLIRRISEMLWRLYDSNVLFCHGVKSDICSIGILLQCFSPWCFSLNYDHSIRNHIHEPLINNMSGYFRGNFSRVHNPWFKHH